MSERWRPLLTSNYSLSQIYLLNWGWIHTKKDVSKILKGKYMHIGESSMQAAAVHLVTVRSELINL